jgi:predicted methyltransferase
MSISETPLLTHDVAERILAAVRGVEATVAVSLDLGRTTATVGLEPAGIRWRERVFPLPEGLKDRTIYYWDGTAWAKAARYAGGLIKLVPTTWGPPTFEIDGIKMLPTAKISPLEDARVKVAMVAPRGRRILDTCGGLGYFAACCLAAGSAAVQSFEKNPEVLWLRQLNPWSPGEDPRLSVTHADISQAIVNLPTRGFDAVLHDPPRFGIAGELYSQRFYNELARVLKPRGRLFHYTGTPNKLTSGRDVPGEVMQRLRRAGFTPERRGDGVLAVRER